MIHFHITVALVRVGYGHTWVEESSLLATLDHRLRIYLRQIRAKIWHESMVHPNTRHRIELYVWLMRLGVLPIWQEWRWDPIAAHWHVAHLILQTHLVLWEILQTLHVD